jgi:hypothetical protein
MTLSKTLERRKGAADDFRLWATDIAKQWSGAEVLCAAHSSTLFIQNQSPSIAAMIMTALERVELTLKHHENKFG